MNYQQKSENYKKTFVSKLPTWAWIIVFYVCIFFGSYFDVESSLNSGVYNLILGSNVNLWWLHFVQSLLALALNLLIANGYSFIMMSNGKGKMDVPRKEFVNIFIFFFCLYNLALGAFNTIYFFVPISIVFGTILVPLILRFVAVLGIFFLLSKYYFNEYNRSKGVTALFVAYLIFEGVLIFLSFMF